MNQDQEFSITARSISNVIAQAVRCYEMAAAKSQHPVELSFSFQSQLNGILSVLYELERSDSRDVLIAEARTAQDFINNASVDSILSRSPVTARHSAPYEAGRGVSA